MYEIKNQLLRRLRDGSNLRKFLFYLRTHLMLKPKLKRVMKKDFGQLPAPSAKPVVVVPLLEMSHYQHVHILLLAKSFSLRGYDVVVIVCDEFLAACELKSSRNANDANPCFRCTTNRIATLKLYGLKCFTLSELFSGIDDPVQYGIGVMDRHSVSEKEIDRIVEDSVSRYYFGAAALSPSAEIKRVRADQKDTAFISLALGEILLRRFRPSICFNNMKYYSAWAPLFGFLGSQGAAPIVVSQTAFNLNSIRINNADIFSHKRTYQRFLSNRNHQALDEAENSQLDSFMVRRLTGNDDLMRESKYFNGSATSGLEKYTSKRNVVLFTNVPWDIGLDEFTGLFSGVLEWVQETIEFFSGHPSVNIWIKPHPEEVRGANPSERSVTEFIKLKYKNLPENVFLIDANLGVDSYSLFPFIDVGVVLTGTLGLEMALNDIKVVSAGISPCHGLGLLTEPASVPEYFDAIEFGDYGVANQEKLRQFCFFYFIHECRKWPLTQRVWGDSRADLTFSDITELEPGKSSDLDAIFDEIAILVEDYKNNLAARED